MVKPPWDLAQQKQVYALLLRVRQMRDHQRNWFRAHERGSLVCAKRAESDVDAALDVLRESLWDSPLAEVGCPD